MSSPELPFRTALGTTFKRPISSFAVPTNAGPGFPGWKWTNIIPEPLATYYSGAFPLVAVRLGFPSSALSLVNYEGIRSSGDRVTGFCELGAGGVVREFWYETEIGSVNFAKDVGTGPSEFVAMTMGPDNGSDAGIAELLTLQGGFDLRLDCINQPTHVQFGESGGDIFTGRGRKAWAASQANSAAIGAEAAVLTTGGFVARNGRAYRFMWAGEVTTSAANTSTFRIRKNTAAGAVVAGAFNYVKAAAITQWEQGWVVGVNNTGADLASYNVCLTLQASAGTSTHNGAATKPRFIEVKDIGRATDYATAVALA